MKMKIIAGFSGIILGLAASNVLACGESLFRVGKGVEFRQYTTPLPGSILAVANTETEFLMLERLAAAGHDVHIVADPSEIHDEISNHQIDLVLAYYSQRDEVAGQIADSGIAYIPVALRDTGEVRDAKRDYERSLSSDDNVKTFLKTIHRELKSRG